MSDDDNSGALREFRFSKKPGIPHDLDSSSEIGVVRKRPIIFSESDSELDNSQVNNVLATHNYSSKVNGLSNGSDSKLIMKTPSILEKEKQMKYLLEIFPNLEAMVIHDMLSRHVFNTDAAAAELSKTFAKQIEYEPYQKWREQYDKNAANLKQNLQNNPASSVLVDQRQTVKRKAPQAEHSRKKKVKRRRSCDSDDSTGSQKHFQDTRVYDSDGDSDVEVSDFLTGDKKRVLEFFGSATLSELQLMNSCSKKKAEILLEMRPFSGWIDLVGKLQSYKSLSTDLLNSAQQVLVIRNNIRQLMRKCGNIAQQMERAVAMGASVKVQPRNLSSSLKLTSYQMVGLNWLTVLHMQGVNGILADEMGLGKTVQVISFLAHLKLIGAAQNTHLVVVPASTLDNWRAEFARWCPELRVFMYYGSQEERRMFRFDFAKGLLADFDVVLTTYTTVGNSPEERKTFRVTPMHYVIFDEAHMLKNMNTQRYENLIRINARHRILLTGTPLQNNLLELMSLLIFVMPKMFAEKTNDLKNLFQKNARVNKKDDDSLPTFEREQIEQAKRIMKPFVLRRLKCDVLQDLPQKIDHILDIPMVPSQKEHYQTLVDSFKNVGNANGQPSYNGVSMMTDLRKLSNHPLLMRYHYDYGKLQDIAKLLAKDPGYKDTKVEYIVDDLVWMSDFEIHTLSLQFKCLSGFSLPDKLMLISGKFLQFDKLLPTMKTNGNRVLIFSQYVIMLNVMEEYLRIRNYSFLRLDGSTPVNTRQELINQFNADSSIFIFLLSTRAGGLGINLTAADTVIIHDIDFNPYNDKQAEDRCHRMGQTKPVTVYRFISQGTIEEGMLQMNREKLKLEREITIEEDDTADVKSVVRLLSSVLGIDSAKAKSLVSPKKKP